MLTDSFVFFPAGLSAVEFENSRTNPVFETEAGVHTFLKNS